MSSREIYVFPSKISKANPWQFWNGLYNNLSPDWQFLDGSFNAKSDLFRQRTSQSSPELVWQLLNFLAGKNLLFLLLALPLTFKIKMRELLQKYLTKTHIFPCRTIADILKSFYQFFTSHQLTARATDINTNYFL